MQMVKVLRKDVLLCNEIESESTSFAYDMPMVDCYFTH